MVSEEYVQTSNGKLGRCIQEVFCTTQTQQTRFTNTLNWNLSLTDGWCLWLPSEAFLLYSGKKREVSGWCL